MAAEFKWYPLGKIANEPSKSGMYRLICNSYWVVNDQEQIPVFRNCSLQSNDSKEIVESLIKSGIYGNVAVRAVFLAKAWLPIRIDDYELDLKAD